MTFGEREFEKIEKSHKYIRRWFSNGDWRYEYPSDQKKPVSRSEAKINIAKRTKLITGIKPLANASERQIDEALLELNLESLAGKLTCPALGNQNIYVIGATQEHIKSTLGKQRSSNEIAHKAKYIPFVKEILRNGKICEKSSSKKGVVYGIIGQVEYFDDKKQKSVKEAVELAVNYDSDKRKFVFSFADKVIKKSLLFGRDSDNFSACPIADTETVSITTYNLQQNGGKININKSHGGNNMKLVFNAESLAKSLGCEEKNEIEIEKCEVEKSENPNDPKFEYYKKLVLQHLEELEKKENKTVAKSFDIVEFIQKSSFPVGTVRTWNGQKFKKTMPGKWVRIYEKESRGAKMAVAALRRKAAQCKNSEELLQLVLANKERFVDSQGKPLGFMQEFSAYVSGLNDKHESGNKAIETQTQEEKTGEYEYARKEYYKQIASYMDAAPRGYRNKKSKAEYLKRALSELAAKGLDTENARGSYDALKDLYKDITGEDYAREENKQEKEPQPIGNGDFGDIYDCFKHKTKEAIDFLLKNKGGEAIGALSHKELGDIDLVYGEEGTAHSDGYGLAKLAKYHPEVLDNLQGIIDDMKVVKKTSNRAQLESKTHKASVRLTWNGKQKNWLLTAYEKGSDVSGSRTDIAGTDSSRKNDTATLANTADSNISQTSEKSSRKPKTLADIREKYQKSRSIEGDEDEIYVGKETIQGKWKLVEADAPSASHDEITFHKTEGFPTGANGTTINDRDYEHDTQAQETVLDIASDFDGRALGFDSPVVVTQDGVVTSGNNRTMSSKLAARKGTDTKYIEALKKRARKFGFTADDVAKFEHPRVVFETEHKGGYTTDEFAKYNESGKKAKSPIEKAVEVSKRMKPQVVESIAETISQFDTMGELYADRKAGRDVFNTLIESGIIQKTDLPQYYTDGAVTAAGKEFVETVLIGSVIDEGNIRALNSEGGKSIRQKLVKAIVPLIENKGMKGYSINKELNEAVNIAVEVSKNHDKFPDVEAFSHQQDMFRKLDPVSIELAKKLEGTQKAFAEFMQEMNGGLRPAANGEADIFLGGTESKEDIVDRILNIKKTVKKALDRFFRIFGAAA